MLQFPVSTQFGRRIPKQKFYQNLDVSSENVCGTGAFDHLG